MRHRSIPGGSTEHPPDEARLQQDRCHVLAEVTLSRTKRAPSQAREFVRRYLCLTHAASAGPAGELVASEIVTLAVREGDGPVTLALGCQATGLLLAVTCPSAGGGRSWVDAPHDRLPLLVARSMADDCGRTITGTHHMLWYVVPTGFSWAASLS